MRGMVRSLRGEKQTTRTHTTLAASNDQTFLDRHRMPARRATTPDSVIEHCAQCPRQPGSAIRPLAHSRDKDSTQDHIRRVGEAVVPADLPQPRTLRSMWRTPAPTNAAADSIKRCGAFVSSPIVHWFGFTSFLLDEDRPYQTRANPLPIGHRATGPAPLPQVCKYRSEAPTPSLAGTPSPNFSFNSPARRASSGIDRRAAKSSTGPCAPQTPLFVDTPGPPSNPVLGS